MTGRSQETWSRQASATETGEDWYATGGATQRQTTTNEQGSGSRQGDRVRGDYDASSTMSATLSETETGTRPGEGSYASQRTLTRNETTQDSGNELSGRFESQSDRSSHEERTRNAGNAGGALQEQVVADATERRTRRGNVLTGQYTLRVNVEGGETTTQTTGAGAATRTLGITEAMTETGDSRTGQFQSNGTRSVRETITEQTSVASVRQTRTRTESHNRTGSTLTGEANATARVDESYGLVQTQAVGGVEVRVNGRVTTRRTEAVSGDTGAVRVDETGRDTYTLTETGSDAVLPTYRVVVTGRAEWQEQQTGNRQSGRYDRAVQHDGTWRRILTGTNAGGQAVRVVDTGVTGGSVTEDGAGVTGTQEQTRTGQDRLALLRHWQEQSQANGEVGSIGLSPAGAVYAWKDGRGVGASGGSGTLPGLADGSEQGVFVDGQGGATGRMGTAAVSGYAGQGDAWLRQYCFCAGTPLLTPDGDEVIEAFKVGDAILSRDQYDVNGALEVRFVEAVFRRWGRVAELRVGGRVIRTTAEHPFFEQRKGWVACELLEAGDWLNTHDGRWVRVEGVVDTGREEVVYNLRVSEDHTYFVGTREWSLSIWAHNSGYGDGDRGVEAVEAVAAEAELASLAGNLQVARTLVGGFVNQLRQEGWQTAESFGFCDGDAAGRIEPYRGTLFLPTGEELTVGVL